MNGKLIGKLVATRGIGSGVNVGRCIAIDGNNILLEAGSFFCRSWKYSDNSYGAFHSLGNGDVLDGEITKVRNDTIITDLAQAVVCVEDLEDKLNTYAKEC